MLLEPLAQLCEMMSREEKLWVYLVQVSLNLCVKLPAGCNLDVGATITRKRLSSTMLGIYYEVHDCWDVMCL